MTKTREEKLETKRKYRQRPDVLARYAKKQRERRLTKKGRELLHEKWLRRKARLKQTRDAALANRKCEQCGSAIPIECIASTKFCSSRCRGFKHAKRYSKTERARTLARKRSKSLCARERNRQYRQRDYVQRYMHDYWRRPEVREWNRKRGFLRDIKKQFGGTLPEPWLVDALWLCVLAKRKFRQIEGPHPTTLRRKRRKAQRITHNANTETQRNV